MARYTGPKNRLSRRENMDLGLKTPGSHAHASMLRKQNVKPGMHGAKTSRRKVSGFGTQLREKQKVKRLYGVLERQFRKVFEMAKKWKGNTGEKLLQFMERRLDNTVYRMGFAPTRASARQFVTHGHVMVNGKKLSIPSYFVEKDDVVTLTSKGMEIPAVKKMMEEKGVGAPAWIERKGPAGKVLRYPEREDIQDDINEQLIVEFYSR